MEDIPTTANGTSPAAASASAAVESSSKNEQITELAMNLLVQGRRHLLVSDIPSAIAALAESSRLLVELFGEFADECAESYYYYGMALLEMARTDCDVLGDAVEGGDKAEGVDSSDEDEENDDEEDEEVSGDEEQQDKDEKHGETNGKLNGAESEKLSEASKELESEPGKSTESDKNEVNRSEKLDETEKKEIGESEKMDEGEKKEVDESLKVNNEAEKKDDVSKNIVEDVKVIENKSNPETITKADEASAEKSNDIEMEDAEASSENTNGESLGKPQVQDKTVSKPKNESKGKSLKAPGSSSSEAKPENGDEEDISEDVSNLQLAWEVFELAKNIYQRKAETDPAAKPKLADALIRLAEVAIESENYTSAIDDLQKCLEIQKSSFPEDSRSLAETYYQLGVAYTFTTEFKDAVKSFESAVSVIQLRIENLKNPVEKKPSMEEPRNLFHTIEGEIEELETLLPDIREKIADTIDLEKEALRKVTDNGTNGAGTSSSAGAVTDGPVTESTITSGESSNSAKPATDITHLIRKKRKPEESCEIEASAAKKVCSDAVVTDAVEAK